MDNCISPFGSFSGILHALKDLANQYFKLISFVTAQQGGGFPGWMESQERDHLSFLLS